MASDKPGVKMITVRRSSIQGRGVFAVRRIRKGQRIIEYKGERITAEEELKRYDDDQMDRHHTFLFGLSDGGSIDAASGGSIARFINHCCAPNCEAVEEDGRIFIEAIKNIQPGIELTYDYNFEHEGRITEADFRKFPCHCGVKSCRRTILKLTRKNLPGRTRLQPVHEIGRD